MCTHAKVWPPGLLISHKSKNLSALFKIQPFFLSTFHYPNELSLTNSYWVPSVLNILPWLHLRSVWWNRISWKYRWLVCSHICNFFIRFYSSIHLTFPTTTLNIIVWVKSCMYEEKEYEKFLMGHIFEILTHADWSQGTTETSTVMKWNFRAYQLQFQVSGRHCVTLAVTWLKGAWQCDRDRDTCHRASRQQKLATYANRWSTSERKEAQKHSNLWATSAAWWQAASQDQRVSF